MKGFGLTARTRDALGNDAGTELLRSELFSIEQLKRHAVTLSGRRDQWGQTRLKSHRNNKEQTTF
jgi:hypothetical protein